MTSEALSNLIDHGTIETVAATWLARRDNAQAWTSADEQELHAWLEEHVAHRVAWLRLKSAWERADALRVAQRSLDDRQGMRFHGLSLPKLRRRGPIAAFACTALACAALLITGAPDLTFMEGQRFATAVGARQGVTLADGSRVMLNTSTSARVAIGRHERKFWLDEGEAFFEIQHDPSRPFVLVAGNDRITVLGTKFSVRHDGEFTRVAVLEGRVKFEAGAAARPAENPANATILTPNYSAISNAGSVLVGVKSAEETERELSWRGGWLEFDNRSLADIAAEFNRYNRRQLVVDDAGGLMLSGRFDMYNVDGFVRSVEAGFGIVARTEGDRIRLSTK
jgi:transmembrane sensor